MTNQIKTLEGIFEDPKKPCKHKLTSEEVGSAFWKCYCEKKCDSYGNISNPSEFRARATCVRYEPEKK